MSTLQSSGCSGSGKGHQEPCNCAHACITWPVPVALLTVRWVELPRPKGESSPWNNRVCQGVGVSSQNGHFLCGCTARLVIARYLYHPGKKRKNRRKARQTQALMLKCSVLVGQQILVMYFPHGFYTASTGANKLAEICHEIVQFRNHRYFPRDQYQSRNCMKRSFSIYVPRTSAMHLQMSSENPSDCRALRASIRTRIKVHVVWGCLLQFWWAKIRHPQWQHSVLPRIKPWLPPTYIQSTSAPERRWLDCVMFADRALASICQINLSASLRPCAPLFFSASQLLGSKKPVFSGQARSRQGPNFQNPDLVSGLNHSSSKNETIHDQGWKTSKGPHPFR